MLKIGALRGITTEDIVSNYKEVKAMADEEFNRIRPELGTIRLSKVYDKLEKMKGSKASDIIFFYSFRKSADPSHTYFVPIRVRENCVITPKIAFRMLNAGNVLKEVPLESVAKMEDSKVKINPFTGLVKAVKRVFSQDKPEKLTIEKPKLVRKFPSTIKPKEETEEGEKIPEYYSGSLSETLNYIAYVLREVEKKEEKIEGIKMQVDEAVKKILEETGLGKEKEKLEQEKKQFENIAKELIERISTLEEYFRITRGLAHLVVDKNEKLLFGIESKVISPTSVNIDRLNTIIDTILAKNERLKKAFKKAIDEYLKEETKIRETMEIIPGERIPKVWRTEIPLQPEKGIPESIPGEVKKGQVSSAFVSSIREVITILREISRLLDEGLRIIGEVKLPAFAPLRKVIRPEPVFAPAFAQKKKEVNEDKKVGEEDLSNELPDLDEKLLDEIEVSEDELEDEIEDEIIVDEEEDSEDGMVVSDEEDEVYLKIGDRVKLDNGKEGIIEGFSAADSNKVYVRIVGEENAIYVDKDELELVETVITDEET
ncbi:MAG TPA: hypothetical protein PKV21_08870 [bacterium]|nr:hypothetical protein [bacterium]